MVVMHNDAQASQHQGNGSTAESSLGQPILDPASPAMSLGSPVFRIPGSMPSIRTAIQAQEQSQTDPKQQQQQQQEAQSKHSSAPSSSGMSTSTSTSGLTSFLRNFGLSGSPARSQDNTVSTKDASASTINSASGSDPTSRIKYNTVQDMRPPSPIPLSPTSSASNNNPNPNQNPSFAGGSQVKRAFSNSSAVKRIRKLSNPVPSLLSGGSSTNRESVTAGSSTILTTSPAHETFRPTMLRHGSKDVMDSTARQTRTAPNTNTDKMASSDDASQAAPVTAGGSGIISSSLGFITSLATFDKLPSVFGLGTSSSSGENYPRGEHGSISDLNEDMNLQLEDAAGHGEIYRETSRSQQDPATATATVVSSNRTISESDNVGGKGKGTVSVSPPSESRALDGTFEPDAPSRTLTSTTLESNGAVSNSSRHALSPADSSLTYASTSSTSLQHTDEAAEPNSSSIALPLAPIPAPYTPSGTILDPLTFQTLTRKTSEADARRVERERQIRGRQLDLLDRLHEQAENPHLRFVHPVSPPPSFKLTPRDAIIPPISPVKEYKQSNLGMGSPPASSKVKTNDPQLHVARPVEAEKPIRRRSLFARLGFSPSSKANSASTKRGTSPSPITPSVPRVQLPQSSSVTSFNSTTIAQSEIGSFQAVAEATVEPGARAASPVNVNDRAMDSLIASAGSPRSDTSSAMFADTAAFQAAAALSKKSRYIKTKLRNKSKREFGQLFLAQELHLGAAAQSQSKGSGDASTALQSEKGQDTVTKPDSPSLPLNDAKNGKKSSKTGRLAATWALKFSPDGNYLASAGQDGVIRIWQVISGSEERENVLRTLANPMAEDAAGAEGGSSGISLTHTPLFADTPNGKATSKRDKRNSKLSVVSTSTQDHGFGNTSNSGFTASQVINAAGKAAFPAPVFGHKPLHEWRGHTSDVLDVSWSKNNFLLSSSMDKTVRLWHITRKECLCAFQHPDFVTSIAFHPKDDRYFLSGSLDAKLRLWSIPDKKVHCWTQLPELITSVAFTSDGKLASAGTFVGLCLFFDVRDLTFIAKLHSKSTRGKNAKGRKITSIVSFPKADPSEPERVLVTSNDSRMRLWDITGICGLPADAKANPPRLISERHLEAKYKAHENTSSQIKATFSDDGRYVISGSEDRQCYIWLSGFYEFPHPFAHTSKKGADRSPGCETFNPNSLNDSHCPTGITPGIVTCAVFAPTETKATLARGGDPLVNQQTDEPTAGRLHRSASQTSSVASSNPNGNSVSGRSDDSHANPTHNAPSCGSIIITADDSTGTIRVFRNYPVFDVSMSSRDAKSITGSTKEAIATFSGGSTQRRHSQISKVSRSASRVRGSFDRQRRTTESQVDVEELAS